MGSHFEFHTPLCVLRIDIIGSCRLAIRVMYGLDLTKMLAESEFVNYSYNYLFVCLLKEPELVVSRQFYSSVQLTAFWVATRRSNPAILPPSAPSTGRFSRRFGEGREHRLWKRTPNFVAGFYLPEVREMSFRKKEINVRHIYTAPMDLCNVIDISKTQFVRVCSVFWYTAGSGRRFLGRA